MLNHEAHAYWMASKRIRLREGTVEEIMEAVDEIECLSMHTDNRQIRTRCEGVPGIWGAPIRACVSSA